MKQYGKIEDTLIYREWIDDDGEWTNWLYVGNSDGLESFVLDDLPQPSNEYIPVSLT